MRAPSEVQELEGCGGLSGMIKICILKTCVNAKWMTEAGVQNTSRDKVIKEWSSHALVYLVHFPTGNTSDS